MQTKNVWVFGMGALLALGIVACVGGSTRGFGQDLAADRGAEPASLKPSDFLPAWDSSTASTSASPKARFSQVARLAQLRTPPPAAPHTPSGLASLAPRPGAATPGRATSSSTLNSQAALVAYYVETYYVQPYYLEEFAELRQCESSDNYQTDTGNGYFGAYQFDEETWLGLGYSGYPNEASPSVQDQAAEQLQAQRGWEPWPTCSRLLGL
jgi:hypothetical protein